MLIGAHVSIAGGIHKAPERAQDFGCEIFQMFTRSPQGGPAPQLTPELVHSFLSECQRCNQQEWVVHTPYYINLAHPKEGIRKNSIRIIREELERASLIQARYIMTHLGSSREVGENQGLLYCIEGIQKILDGYHGSAQFLIEIAAGAGCVMGGTFENIAQIIEKIEYDVGVCFDTQHGFAAGYDLRTPEAVNKTFDEFDRIIGLSKLKISHCNDSKIELGGQKDRHEHIGRGYIGELGFSSWINDKRLKNINLYCETEYDFVKEDIQLLKQLRDN